MAAAVTRPCGHSRESAPFHFIAPLSGYPENTETSLYPWGFFTATTLAERIYIYIHISSKLGERKKVALDEIWGKSHVARIELKPCDIFKPIYKNRPWSQLSHGVSFRGILETRTNISSPNRDPFRSFQVLFSPPVARSFLSSRNFVSYRDEVYTRVYIIDLQRAPLNFHGNYATISNYSRYRVFLIFLKLNVLHFNDNDREEEGDKWTEKQKERERELIYQSVHY